VLEYQGVIFVDDSKSTTIDSALAAIKSQDRPIHLLAGGIFKGGDLRLILPVLQEKVRAIYLFGASREIFEEAWQDFDGSLTWDATLEAAVVRAATQAQTGDCVLLSPATASFDLFANYKERGRAFQQCVRQWAGEKSCG
jgi:UDP-N-acetylmuramoylalanine--D-glutamate ligase